MNLLNLYQSWPIIGPWQLTALSGGTNNYIWRAEAADGQCYVLRLITDPEQIPRFRYEAALLEALSRQQPPFLLPLLLRVLEGDFFVAFEQEMGATTFATLSPLLPGHPPQDRSDLILAANAAYALAWLDHALAALPAIHLPEGVVTLPRFGELAHVHPLVPDPLVAVEQLPIDRDHAQQLRHLLAAALEKAPDLYRRLPQQLLHRDFDPSNILVDNQQVTAVIDFEFAGTDLRVLDLCVALSWWPANLLGSGKEWQVIDTFGRSYVSHFPLSEPELLALPDVWRLRDATSFVHRMGRYFAGMETDARMQDRAQHSLWREAWISTHQDTLVQHALAWGL